MNCTHEMTFHELYYYRCRCCNRYTHTNGQDFCSDCEPPFVPLAKPVDFSKHVEMSASVGVCMFCSHPAATMKFKGDESVHICERCVKP